MYPASRPLTSVYLLSQDQAGEVPAPPPPEKQTHVHPFHQGPLFTLKNVLWLLFFLLLSLATRCANYRHVFVTQGDRLTEVYYIDGDCYSRMTRVREVLAHGGIIHHHAWENYPQGTWPHTTAPMDYLIAGLALLLKPFTGNYIDFAGAIVSPILGVLTTAFLALWARELNQQYRRVMLLLASLSPILVHGTELGRPDHQSLQIFLLAIALGAELIMARAPRKGWSIVSGFAWGLALWVSLYEPLILLLVVFATKLFFYRTSLFVKERLWSGGIMLAIVAIGYVLEGFNYSAPDATFLHYFQNWAGTIGEMSSTSILSPLLWQWVGLGLLFAPLLLLARIRDTKRSMLLLTLMVTTFILTLVQVRWGYFFALIYAMSLPWQLSLFSRRWLVWTLFLLSLWPVAQDWETRLFPDEKHDFLRDARVNDQRRLRQAAEFLKASAHGGILAPWWWSPELVYWSGQPAVAGSSHESLSGIVDTARFFAADDLMTAKKILIDRHVATVVLPEPELIVDQSLRILSQPAREHTMAEVLWEKPHSAPPFLHIVFDNTVIKIFLVVLPPAPVPIPPAPPA